jgi:hypothetical protein
VALTREEITLEQSEKEKILDHVLKVAAHLAVEMSTEEKCKTQLASLISELASAKPKAADDKDVSVVAIGQGANLYRALHVRATDTAYIVVLPPDPPAIEDCTTCKGRRIVGSEKK